MKAFLHYILVLIIKIIHVNSHSLSATTVLLPITSPDAEPVIYDLFINDNGGCFKFSNTREDVVKVTPLDVYFGQKHNFNCVKSVRLTSTSSYTTRESSVIIFTDQVTGMTLKTHVFVDKIHKLEIVTRRRILYIGDVKEKVEVMAYDLNGNLMSSLLGGIFEWKIICDNCKNRPPLSLVTFKSSSYQIHALIASIENRGSRGSMILLEALYKGEITLSVRMLDDLYKNKTTSVTFLVREYIVLDPSETQYYLLGGYYDIRALRIVKSKQEEMVISPKSYQLTSSNYNICSIYSNYKTLIANSVGKAVISLSEEYSHLKESDIFQLLVNVVDPTHLTLSCIGQEHWLLEIGKSYRIIIQIYYSDHLLNVSHFTFDTNVAISSNSISITKMDDNHLGFDIVAKEIGISDLSVTISKFTSLYVLETPLSENLVSSVQIEVVESIKVFPSVIIIPYIHKSTFYYNFNVNGGSGRYIWSSALSGIFQDSFEGKFLTPSQPGEFNITVSDRMNKHITSSALIKAYPITRIELIAENSEFPVSTGILIRVKLFAYDPSSKQEILITHFHRSSIQVQCQENLFTQCDNYKQDSFCLLSKTTGCSIVSFSVSNSSKSVVSNIRLCVFIPLKAISNVRIAIPGTFITVNLTGGPLSVYSKKLKSEINTSKEDIFTLNSSSLSGINNRIESFKLQCVKPGNQTIIFVSQIPQTSLPTYRDVVEYKLFCLQPKNLKLIVYPFNNNPRCISELYTLSARENRLSFSLFAANKYFIDDLTGFSLKFYSFPNYGIKTSNPYILSPSKTNVSKVSGELAIFPKSVHGYFKIIVKFTPTLQKYSFWLSFNTFVASNLKFESSSISLLYFKLNKRYMKIYGGSGVLKINQKQPNVVQVKQKDTQVEIVPTQTGFDSILFVDQCSNINPFKLDVFITSLGKVVVLHPEKYRVNKSLTIEIIIYNDLNQIIPNEEQHLLDVNFNFMDRKPDEIVKSLSSENHHVVYNFYTLTPVILDFIVEVTAVTNKTIQSKKVRVEIYDDVQIIPKIVNIIPGVEVKLATYGGPQLNVHTVFNVSGSCALFIPANNSLFSFNSCEEIISACVHSIDNDNHEAYTCDSIPLKVSDLSQVDIYTTSNRFYQGSIVLASLKMYNIYGSITPYISLASGFLIAWSVDEASHIYLEPYNKGQNDQILMSVKKEGSTHIHVEVNPFVNTAKWSQPQKASKIIFILRSLNIFSCDNKILLPIGVKYNLQNRFVNSQSSFRFADTVHPGFSIGSTGILTVPSYPSYSIMAAQVKDLRQDIQHHETVSFMVEVAEVSQIFLLKANVSRNASHGVNNFYTGQDIAYRIVATDSEGRVFDFIPHSLINISIVPLGVVEIVWFKNTLIKLRGVALGKTNIFVNGNPALKRASRLTVDVTNPFSCILKNTSIGDIILYDLPLMDSYQFVFDNTQIIEYVQKENLLYIMGVGVGQTVLQITYQSSTYDVLQINISIPVDVKFSENYPTVVPYRGEKSYFFDLETITDMEQNNYVAFKRYPFKCEIQTSQHLPLHVVEAINSETGKLCCTVKLNDYIKTDVKQLDFHVISTFYDEYGRKLLKIMSKKIMYIPEISLATSVKVPVNVESCYFSEIRLNRISNDDKLQISSDITCIDISYKNQDTDQIAVLLKLDKCLDVIHSNTEGKLTIKHALTDQAIVIPFFLDYHKLICLHESVGATKVLIAILVILICLLIPFLWNTLKPVFQYINLLFIKLKILLGILRQPNADSFASYHLTSSPKICTLKPRDFLSDDGNLAQELYTTRKELMNASFK